MRRSYMIHCTSALAIHGMWQLRHTRKHEHMRSKSTDRGAEKALVRVPPLRFDAAFPFFLPSEELRFEIDAGEQAGDPPEQPNRVGPHPEAVVDPGDLFIFADSCRYCRPTACVGECKQGICLHHAQLCQLVLPSIQCAHTVPPCPILQRVVYPRVFEGQSGGFATVISTYHCSVEVVVLVSCGSSTAPFGRMLSLQDGTLKQWVFTSNGTMMPMGKRMHFTTWLGI